MRNGDELPSTPGFAGGVLSDMTVDTLTITIGVGIIGTCVHSGVAQAPRTIATGCNDLFNGGHFLELNILFAVVSLVQIGSETVVHDAVVATFQTCDFKDVIRVGGLRVIPVGKAVLLA